ncbi:MAG: 3-oxoadipate enol-lactonase [Rubrobacter sp.]|nr:3-oxoadipate enol-lactonase [Rubrobacter sp.]
MSSSLGTTMRMWEAQASTLRERLRLVRYDHRGHGGSPVPSGPYEIGGLGRDVLALMDRVGLDRFSFCGLSLGGMVGMWLASEVPERVERLVLCCTSAKMSPETWETRAQTVRERGVAGISGAVVERWFTPSFFRDHPETVAWASRMLRDTPAEGYAGCCEAIRDLDLRERLGAIEAPTLIVAGAEDPATPPEHAEYLRDSIPGSRLTVVPGAAHLANVEQPEELTRAVLEHLTPVADGRAGR